MRVEIYVSRLISTLWRRCFHKDLYRPDFFLHRHSATRSHVICAQMTEINQLTLLTRITFSLLSGHSERDESQVRTSWSCVGVVNRQAV